MQLFELESNGKLNIAVLKCYVIVELGVIQQYIINLKTAIFYYTEKGKHYIEQPYQGIYVTDVDIDVFIKGIE